MGEKWGGIEVGGGIGISKWEVAPHNPTPPRGPALFEAILAHFGVFFSFFFENDFSPKFQEKFRFFQSTHILMQ